MLFQAHEAPGADDDVIDQLDSSFHRRRRTHVTIPNSLPHAVVWRAMLRQEYHDLVSIGLDAGCREVLRGRLHQRVASGA